MFLHKLVLVDESFRWATEYKAAPTVEKVRVLGALSQQSLRYGSVSQTPVQLDSQCSWKLEGVILPSSGQKQSAERLRNPPGLHKIQWWSQKSKPVTA